MKTIAIIQARQNSTRLPGKVLLPIGDTNALQMIVDKCKAHKLIDETVVAMPTSVNDNILSKYCCDNNIKAYCGDDEENVLKRVYDSAKYYQADIIIDITADCPFIDLSELHHYLGPVQAGLDYASNVIDRSFPDGLDLQVYSFKALERLYNLVGEPQYQQHGGWNFTRYLDVFSSLNIYAQGAVKWPELRVTLDTAEDYAVINMIYMWLGAEATPLQIVNFMRNNPKIMGINQAVKAKEPGEL